MHLLDQQMTLNMDQISQLQNITADSFEQGTSGDVHVIKFSKNLGVLERTGVMALAFVSTVSTLGLGLLSKDVRGLWRQSAFGNRQVKATILENSNLKVKMHGLVDGMVFCEIQKGVGDQIKKKPPPLPKTKPLNWKQANHVKALEKQLKTAKPQENYSAVYKKLNKQFPDVSFSQLHESAEDLQKLTPTGIRNYLGYNCYLSTICQRLTRVSSYNDMLNVELSERHSDIEVKLQLLLRGVVSELRNNRMPSKELILALHQTLLSVPGFVATGQQDATEIFLLFSRIMNVPIDEVPSREVFYYDIQQKDVAHPKVEERKIVNEWGYKVKRKCYSGEYEESSNFFNVFQAFPNNSSKTGTITDSRATASRALISLKKGTEDLSVFDGIKTTGLHFDAGLVDSETKGSPIENSAATRMRVVHLKEGVMVDSYDHADWGKSRFSKMTPVQLKNALGEGEEFIVCEKKGSRTQYAKAPPQVEVNYKSGSKNLKDSDFSLSMDSYVDGECPDYELVDIIWTSSGQSEGSRETSGHYIYFRKQGENWFEYNDSVVTERSQKDVIKRMQGKGYSLLYQPIKK